VTRLAGLAPILSAKSARLEPRRHADDARTVTAGHLHAAERRRLHLLELLTLRALALASAHRTATTAAERTLGATAAVGAAATTTGTTLETAACRSARRHRHRVGRSRPARRGARLGERGRLGRPDPRDQLDRPAGRRPGGSASCRGWGVGHRRMQPAGGAATRRGGRTRPAALRSRHALARRERVVAGPSRPGHALARRERVVARSWRAGAGTLGAGVGRQRRRPIGSRCLGMGAWGLGA
jgi:hypothetical protein